MKHSCVFGGYGWVGWGGRWSQTGAVLKWKRGHRDLIWHYCAICVVAQPQGDGEWERKRGRKDGDRMDKGALQAKKKMLIHTHRQGRMEQGGPDRLIMVFASLPQLLQTANHTVCPVFPRLIFTCVCWHFSHEPLKCKLWCQCFAIVPSSGQPLCLVQISGPTVAVTDISSSPPLLIGCPMLADPFPLVSQDSGGSREPGITETRKCNEGGWEKERYSPLYHREKIAPGMKFHGPYVSASTYVSCAQTHKCTFM